MFVKRKWAFISLSSLVWGKSLTFCMRLRSCARADDAKIVRSRNAQCKTRESPWGVNFGQKGMSMLTWCYLHNNFTKCNRNQFWTCPLGKLQLWCAGLKVILSGAPKFHLLSVTWISFQKLSLCQKFHLQLMDRLNPSTRLWNPLAPAGLSGLTLWVFFLHAGNRFNDLYMKFNLVVNFFSWVALQTVWYHPLISLLPVFNNIVLYTLIPDQ